MELRILTDRSPSNFSMTCIFVECNLLYSISLKNHGKQSKHVSLPNRLKWDPKRKDVYSKVFVGLSVVDFLRVERNS